MCTSLHDTTMFNLTCRPVAHCWSFFISTGNFLFASYPKSEEKNYIILFVYMISSIQWNIVCFLQICVTNFSNILHTDKKNMRKRPGVSTKYSQNENIFCQNGRILRTFWQKHSNFEKFWREKHQFFFFIFFVSACIQVLYTFN